MKTDYLSRHLVYTMTALAAACGMMLSCSKETVEPDPGTGPGTEPEPAPVLENQIEYKGGDWTDIRSVIYEVTDTDLYTFWLSPTEGLTSVVAMVEADDFLLVSARNPKGAVDTETGEFTVTYGDDVNVSASSDNVKEISLSVSFTAGTPATLGLALDLALTDGTTLKADYDGSCSKAVEVELLNQYEMDDVVYGLGSAVAWRNHREAATTYYLYTESGITESTEESVLQSPAIVVHISDEMKGSENPVNLSEVTDGKVQIDMPDGFSTVPGPMTGTLSVSEIVDGSHNRLVLSLDVTAGGKRLRANFTNEYTYGYEALPTFTVTRPGSEPLTSDLTKVFLHTSGPQSIFMLGDASEAETAEGLMDGTNAVKITLAGDGNSFDISEAGFALYNYESYTTADAANLSGYSGVEGEIYTDRIGNKVYLYYHVEFISVNIDTDRVVAEGEWYGEVTSASENTDLTPVRPLSPTITITDPLGVETLYSNEIERVEMRRHTGYSFRGQKDTWYYFYFVQKDVEISWQGISKDRRAVPLLTIPESFITGEDIDLSNNEKYWSIEYTNSNLSSSYGNASYMNCPVDAVINVEKNDKTWTLRFSMTNTYTVVGPGSPGGNGSRFVIEWQGPLTEYSGSETNDYTDY